jgi:hypothetical protein
MTTWNQRYQETRLPGQVGYPAAMRVMGVLRHGPLAPERCTRDDDREIVCGLTHPESEADLCPFVQTANNEKNGVMMAVLTVKCSTSADDTGLKIRSLGRSYQALL